MRSPEENAPKILCHIEMIHFVSISPIWIIAGRSSPMRALFHRSSIYREFASMRIFLENSPQRIVTRFKKTLENDYPNGILSTRGRATGNSSELYWDINSDPHNCISKEKQLFKNCRTKRQCQAESSQRKKNNETKSKSENLNLGFENVNQTGEFIKMKWIFFSFLFEKKKKKKKIKLMSPLCLCDAATSTNQK